MKTFFPLGRVFSAPLENHRADKNQKAADIQAVGHYQPFITHDLIYDPAIQVPEPTTPANHKVSAQARVLHDEARMKESHGQCPGPA